MSKPTLVPDDFERLKRERDAFDRRYNDALTALDRATIREIPQVPPPPPAFDAHQIAPLNHLWKILPDGGLAFGEGWRGRLRRFIWRYVGPLFEQQQQFNGALADHLNRNAAMQHGAGEALHVLMPLVASQIEALATFESRLVQWAQQITGYVDTKDRDVGGRLTAELEAVTLEAMTDMIDVTQKRWESTVASERRTETTLGVLQQSSLTLKRELERLMAGAGTSAGTAEARDRPSPDASTRTSSLDSYKYVGFEDRFRGSRDEIRGRLAEYVPDFEGASDVLDLGCGRGEFLDLLHERGITARGIDINHEMVEACRARGFDVAEGDALGYLEALPDGALGGLFAAQVVEHFEPDYLLRLLETAYHKLRPGSRIVLETINPACWYAFFESYIRDITHVRPLHPDTLVYLLAASGFQRTAVRYSAPFPEAGKLLPVQAPRLVAGLEGGVELAALMSTLNDNATILNRLLFTHLDYAAIGERL
jgi:O-antigen chain-terminating methyltransferase